MASIVGGAGADVQRDFSEVSAPKCAWVIPVLLDSHATAAATLAFRFFFSPHHVTFAFSFPYQHSKVQLSETRSHHRARLAASRRRSRSAAASRRISSAPPPRYFAKTTASMEDR